jgi:hypothetical protein
MKAAVQRLAAFLQAQEAAVGLRQRARTRAAHRGFVAAVESIACNLAALPLAGPGRALAVPRSNAAMWSPRRYRPAAYGDHFRDVLDLMAHPEVRLIETVKRGYAFAGGRSAPSTVRPTATFHRHVRPDLVRWDAFKREEEPEVLILKGRKDRRTGTAGPVAYRETAQTRRKRAEVRRINAHLSAAPFWLASLGDGLADHEGQPVDPTRRTVRRIFNNGSWREGGRLYGGFWETMRREDRRLLRITTPAHPEGEPVANVDHGQLFIRLIYIQAGLTPPEGDLYAVPPYERHRDGIKQLVNALLLAPAPLKNWPKDARPEFPPRTRLRDVLTPIAKHHAAIAHLFGTGVGLRLFLRESEMLIATVLRLFREGVTALPLHDAVLVAVSEAGRAEAAMREAFAGLTDGARASIKTHIP